MLYPPYEVKGFMVSGFGSPEEGQLFFPESLKEELESINSPYQLYVKYHDKKYENTDLFLRDISEFLSKFEKWIYYLVGTSSGMFFL